MRIQRGVINEVPVTLSELKTLSAPYYLFEFINDTNVASYVLINSADDLASTDEQARFNLFSIEEVSSGSNPLSGTITLVNGDYQYTIYEQTSSTNIDPTQTDGIVEKGICTVYSATPTIENKTYNPSIENKVYNG